MPGEKAYRCAGMNAGLDAPHWTSLGNKRWRCSSLSKAFVVSSVFNLDYYEHDVVFLFT